MRTAKRATEWPSLVHTWKGTALTEAIEEETKRVDGTEDSA